MKKIFYIYCSIFFVFLFSSCNDLFPCKPNLLSEQDLEWVKGTEGDKIQYRNQQGKIFEFVLNRIELLKENEGKECIQRDIRVVHYFSETLIKIDGIAFEVRNTKYDHNIAHHFSKSLSSGQFSSIGKTMSCIGLDKNDNCDSEKTFYSKITELNSFKHNNKIYEKVYLVEDLKPDFVPIIDIKKFYAHSSGILRIEFYDDEVWELVD